MIPYKVFWGLVFILMYIPIGYGQNPKVSLPGTEVLTFKSVVNNRDYILYIALPESYSDTTKTYPVLYVLDAQWSFTFPSIRGIQNGQYYDGFIPEMIIVGITWPDDYEGNRARDFTSVAIKEMPNSGGAAKFIDVIQKGNFQNYKFRLSH